MDTSGFYSYDGKNLIYGHSYVVGPGFLLLRESRDTYEYPVNGWYWFWSQEEATAFWNLVVE